MPLELHRITSESDLSDFSLIQTRAFAYSGGMASLVTPTPLPADYIEKSTEKHIKSLREEADVTYLKVIDTDLDGKMIAGAKWRINEKERTEEEIQSMLPVVSEADKENQGLIDFLGFLSRVRREYVGTKSMYRMSVLLRLFIAPRLGFGELILSSAAHPRNRPRASPQRRRSHAPQMGSRASRQSTVTGILGVVGHGQAALCKNGL
jgi:hypothetical protein